ncbi:MAG TPA: 6-O-methylguanine DNA methyltransferase [Candidatus Omnitrophica bacterium]|nr:6-O-methylguanine DNA methyltransferase [Candidatus Omnitrophota bacterium]HCI44649.1 6-O-methylguanine DNA methyltransferase [Candidatus Omnitrophota bacterium]
MTEDWKRMNNKSRTKLTKFQWKVLAVTATIPLGETRSYQWVARKIGSPKAARAVGQALRRNPHPLIIPCHRVIHEDGSLGAYAGKFDKRKARLLKKERGIAVEMTKSVESARVAQ